MFVEYFKFVKQPFGSTPDPSFLFQGDSHREALASLYCGFYGNRGFTALIAEPGMGKTTLLFEFLDHIQARAVFLFNTLCDPSELLSLILRDLNITPGQSAADQYRQLNTVLIAEARAGRRFVLVIDEAQNLSTRALEAVRLLTNFETPREKLMQVVLAGQPELADTLSRPEVTQLQQRISTVCRLSPLTSIEVSAYIEHRLQLAGCRQRDLFTPAAIDLIARASHGIPRTINTYCFNSLSLCRARNAKQVNEGMVAEAISDLQLPVTSPASALREPIAEVITTAQVALLPRVKAPQNRVLWVAATILLCICAGIGTTTYLGRTFLQVSSNTPHDTTLNAENVKPQSQLSVRPPAESSLQPSSIAARAASDSLKVTISQGDTLEGIATTHLGTYDGSVLRDIKALNPRITDPNHIESGRTLRLPGRGAPTTSKALIRKEP